MHKKHIYTFASMLLLASNAFGISVSVNNPSFETLPSGGYNNFCGGDCAFTAGLSIPGWNSNGNTGQGNITGFNGNPSAYDGSVSAYSNGGSIWQDVGIVSAGTTYILQVEFLHRTDTAFLSLAQLEIGSTLVSAMGIDTGLGTWSNWVATYTAPASDAGKTLTILLSATGLEGNFDAVRLDASQNPVPEPSTLALMVFGLAGFGFSKRKIIN